MTEDAPAPPPRKRGLRIAPIVAGVLVLAAIVAVPVLASRQGDDGTPPRPAPFATPAPVDGVLQFVVQQNGPGGLVLTDGSGQPVDPGVVAPGARVDVLELVPAEAADTLPGIEAGDTIHVVGVPNQVRSFVIRYLVVVPAGTDLLTGPGFDGAEVSDDPNAAVVLKGIVASADAQGVLLDAEEGASPVRLAATGIGAATVYRVREGAVEELPAGTRVALRRADGGADSIVARPPGRAEAAE